jgi:hypothetical protein
MDMLSRDTEEEDDEDDDDVHMRTAEEQTALLLNGDDSMYDQLSHADSDLYATVPPSYGPSSSSFSSSSNAARLNVSMEAKSSHNSGGGTAAPNPSSSSSSTTTTDSAASLRLTGASRASHMSVLSVPERKGLDSDNDDEELLGVHTSTHTHTHMHMQQLDELQRRLEHKLSSTESVQSAPDTRSSGDVSADDVRRALKRAAALSHDAEDSSGEDQGGFPSRRAIMARYFPFLESESSEFNAQGDGFQEAKTKFHYEFVKEKQPTDLRSRAPSSLIFPSVSGELFALILMSQMDKLAQPFLPPARQAGSSKGSGLLRERRWRRDPLTEKPVLEAPFAISCCPSTFRSLLAILNAQSKLYMQDIDPQAEGESGAADYTPNMYILWVALRLTKAHVCQLSKCQTLTGEVALIPVRVLSNIKDVCMLLAAHTPAQVYEQLDKPTGSLMSATYTMIRREAIECLAAGFSVFMPTSVQRLELVLLFLKNYDSVHDGRSDDDASNEGGLVEEVLGKMAEFTAVEDLFVGIETELRDPAVDMDRPSGIWGLFLKMCDELAEIVEKDAEVFSFAQRPVTVRALALLSNCQAMLLMKVASSMQQSSGTNTPNIATANARNTETSGNHAFTNMEHLMFQFAGLIVRTSSRLLPSYENCDGAKVDVTTPLDESFIGYVTRQLLMGLPTVSCPSRTAVHQELLERLVDFSLQAFQALNAQQTRLHGLASDSHPLLQWLADVACTGLSVVGHYFAVSLLGDGTSAIRTHKNASLQQELGGGLLSNGVDVSFLDAKRAENTLLLNLLASSDPCGLLAALQKSSPALMPVPKSVRAWADKVGSAIFACCLKHAGLISMALEYIQQMRSDPDSMASAAPPKRLCRLWHLVCLRTRAHLGTIKGRGGDVKAFCDEALERAVVLVHASPKHPNDFVRNVDATANFLRARTSTSERFPIRGQSRARMNIALLRNAVRGVWRLKSLLKRAQARREGGQESEQVVVRQVFEFVSQSQITLGDLTSHGEQEQALVASKLGGLHQCQALVDTMIGSPYESYVCYLLQPLSDMASQQSPCLTCNGNAQEGCSRAGPSFGILNGIEHAPVQALRRVRHTYFAMLTSLLSCASLDDVSTLHVLQMVKIHAREDVESLLECGLLDELVKFVSLPYVQTSSPLYAREWSVRYCAWNVLRAVLYEIPSYGAETGGRLVSELATALFDLTQETQQLSSSKAAAAAAAADAAALSESVSENRDKAAKPSITVSASASALASPHSRAEKKVDRERKVLAEGGKSAASLLAVNRRGLGEATIASDSGSDSVSRTYQRAVSLRGGLVLADQSHLPDVPENQHRCEFCTFDK